MSRARRERIARAGGEGLSRLHHLGRLAGLFRRQAPPPLPRGGGRWLDHLKIKVGRDLEDDKRRCAILREEIGPDRFLMIDANQIWDVEQAIDWVTALAPYRPLWIEEPTSPDDVLGHAAIRKAVKPLGIGVATGEMCQNRVIFKQLMQAGAIDFCQIDSCRLGGVNEVLAVLLLAKKFGIPVCPHAGGVGLCEYVQHLAMIDFVCVAGSMEGRVLEYVDHLHEHFFDPVRMRAGRYMPPEMPGYSITMKPRSLDRFEFPAGAAWAKPGSVCSRLIGRPAHCLFGPPVGLFAVAGAGQIEHDRGSLTERALQLDAAPKPLDEMLGHGQPHARSPARRLGGVEGVEGMLCHLGGHAASGVRYPDTDIASLAQICPLGAEFGMIGLDDQPAAAGHRVAGIDRQIQQGVLELVAVANGRGASPRPKRGRIRCDPPA